MFHKLVTGHKSKDGVTYKLYSLVELSLISIIEETVDDVYDDVLEEDVETPCLSLSVGGKSFTAYDITMAELETLILRTPKNVAFLKGDRL